MRTLDTQKPLNVQLLQTYDLDALFLATYAHGRGAYNRVE